MADLRSGMADRGHLRRHRHANRVACPSVLAAASWPLSESFRVPGCLWGSLHTDRLLLLGCGSTGLFVHHVGALVGLGGPTWQGFALFARDQRHQSQEKPKPISPGTIGLVPRVRCLVCLRLLGRLLGTDWRRGAHGRRVW